MTSPSERPPPESAVEACRAIQDFWRRTRHSDPVQARLMMRDYLHKARGLNRLDLAELDRAALNILVDDLEFEQSMANAMPQYDVGILTVQPKEWFAVRHVFDLHDKRVGYGPEGQHYYATDIPCPAMPSGVVRAIFAVVGEGLNVQAGLATKDLLSRFSIDAVFLVGMAVGLEVATAIGDVVVGRKVVYYEPATLTDTSTRPRYYDRDISPSMKQMLTDYDVEDPKLHRMLASHYVRANNEMMPDSFNATRRVTINAKRDIASGEKIIENDLLEHLIENREERIIAADQESWGFAVAAGQHPWLVFRGIADHGRDRTTNHQFAATVAAAAALQHFISTCYVPSSALPLA